MVEMCQCCQKNTIHCVESLKTQKTHHVIKKRIKLKFWNCAIKTFWMRSNNVTWKWRFSLIQLCSFTPFSLSLSRTLSHFFPHTQLQTRKELLAKLCVLNFYNLCRSEFIVEKLNRLKYGNYINQIHPLWSDVIKVCHKIHNWAKSLIVKWIYRLRRQINSKERLRQKKKKQY